MRVAVTRATEGGGLRVEGTCNVIGEMVTLWPIRALAPDEALRVGGVAFSCPAWSQQATFHLRLAPYSDADLHRRQIEIESVEQKLGFSFLERFLYNPLGISEDGIVERPQGWEPYIVSFRHSTMTGWNEPTGYTNRQFEIGEVTYVLNETTEATVASIVQKDANATGVLQGAFKGCSPVGKALRAMNGEIEALGEGKAAIFEAYPEPVCVDSGGVQAQKPVKFAWDPRNGWRLQ